MIYVKITLLAYFDIQAAITISSLLSTSTAVIFILLEVKY